MQKFTFKTRWIWLPVMLIVLTLALAACPQPEDVAPAPAAPAAEATSTTQAVEESGAPAASPADRVGMYSAPPPMTINLDSYYYATLKTDKGDIEVQLFADRAPVTVNNFVFLAREGYYDNTTFHRVLDGFMAQAGDPSGTGAGGPGYQFEDEIYPGGSFDRPGLLAMANAGPGTNGSQFFITFAPTPWLDGNHTIFGEVISGQEVLDQLTRRDPQQGPDFEGDLLQTIEIEERDSSELPTPTPLPPPTATPTPYAPSSIAPDDISAGDRPLAALPMEERSNAFNTAPEMVIDPARVYTATVSTTQGDIVFALNADLAPIAVNNFVLLASLGFYDGTPVNDVSEVLIFGAPENIPPSYVGYLVAGELTTDNEWGAGAIAYLPAQDPLTGDVLSNGSQVVVFLQAPPVEAAMQISFFGQVVEGLETLQSLTVADVIESVTIAVSAE